MPGPSPEHKIRDAGRTGAGGGRGTGVMDGTAPPGGGARLSEGGACWPRVPVAAGLSRIRFHQRWAEKPRLGTESYAMGLTSEMLALAAGTLQTGSEAKSQRLKLEVARNVSNDHIFFLARCQELNFTFTINLKTTDETACTHNLVGLSPPV